MDRKRVIGAEITTHNLDYANQVLSNAKQPSSASHQQCRETEANGKLNSATLLAYAQRGADYLPMNFKATWKD